MHLPWEAQLALAALAGLLVGVLFTWWLMRGRGVQQQHQALVQKFNDYRRDVDRHFVETAAAVDELNRSYQKVVQHLSSGAQSLMGKEALQEQLAKRGDTPVTVAYLAAGAASAAVAAAAQGEEIPPPPYTDATEAEVVPFTGQPDRVADRIGTSAGTEIEPTVTEAALVAPALPEAAPSADTASERLTDAGLLSAEDLQRPKP